MDKYNNTERWDKWIADGGITEGKDYDITVKIPADLGVGVTTQSENVTLTSTREMGGRMMKDYLKTVTLKVSTWRGISGGAVHYYGKLEFHSVDFAREGSESRLSSCGYGVPDYLESGKFELTRPVTQAEIDANPKMWEAYHDGDKTDRFDKVQEVIDRGTEIFDKWFEKGWLLVLEKTWVSKKETLRK
jgi:hypothetical protein